VPHHQSVCLPSSTIGSNRHINRGWRAFRHVLLSMKACKGSGEGREAPGGARGAPAGPL